MATKEGLHSIHFIPPPFWDQMANLCDRVISEKRESDRGTFYSPHSFLTRGKELEMSRLPEGPGLSTQLGVIYTLGSA